MNFFITCSALGVPQVKLEPLEPVILDNINDTFTVIGNCSATGIPRPQITWMARTVVGLIVINSSDPSVTISTYVMEYTVNSVIQFMNIDRSVRSSSLICTANNAVISVNSTQMQYVAGENRPYLSP